MTNIEMEKDKVLYLFQELMLEQKENDMLNQYLEDANYELAVMLLRKKRVAMMERLHKSQKAIDDLDLLVYQIKKLETERTERK
ncbi:MAG: hypothetical protein MJ055_01700 [Phascolarctobacterium sp.]|nr:hypothetical protein [Phascolarctobacterium sp.]